MQYNGVVTEYLSDLPSDKGFYGNGSFREVRLLVDGMVAGVAFPYAVIFTGGLARPAWKYVRLESLFYIYSHGD